MRKNLFRLIIICIALLICVVGCKNKSKAPQDDTIPSVEETPVVTPEEPETPAVEEPVVPEEPETPAVEEPVLPEEPETPAVEEPVLPEEPETPVVEEPVLPEEPETPVVEEPVLPEEPETPAVEEPVLPEEPETPSSENNDVLSAQKAVEIYFENKSVWMYDELFPMTEFAYYFIDFDLDGVYELVKSDCSGSGSYSSNTYFRINIENQTVEEIPLAEGKIYSQADYINFGATPLRNRADGSFFYLLCDFGAAGFSTTRTTYYKAYLKDGEIHEDSLFEESTTDESIKEYTFGGESFSESEYKERVDSFYEEHEELSVPTGKIKARVFNERSEDEQRQLLIEAYPNPN